MKAAIVGAGISGLATAHAMLRRDPEADLTVFEARARPGGKVESEATAKGYLCEWGVNGFLDKVPRTLELCREVGLEPLPADAAAKKRYVFSEGRLHKLPEKPPEFLASGLLSLGGRLRVMGEVFTGPSGKEDETLAEFGTRHLGREAFEKLIDPMASGVFAGDATQLSLRSCFPRIHEVEAEHGSLIRGLIKLQKQARREGRKDRPGPGPGGLLTSFRNGMSELTDTLAASLGKRLRLGAAIEGVDRVGGRYLLALGNGVVEEFEALVLAVPAYVQAELLRELAPEIASELDPVPYPSLAVVCMGFDRARMGAGLEGFGFLVPSREQRGILGTVADSNVFSNRAPEGKVLLRTLVGGARAPELAEQPDERLQAAVLSELGAILDLRCEPEFVSLYRHERAIPQYLVGHAARLARIDEALSRFPRLLLTGNAYRGVSLNDCVVNADRSARRLRDASGPGGGA